MTIRELHLLLMEAKETEVDLRNLVNPLHEENVLDLKEAEAAADVIRRMRNFIEEMDV